MALMPKRVMHRKQQRGRIPGFATRGNYVAFGDYGLQCMERGWLPARVIEAGRVAAMHFLHREGKIYIRVFPDKPISKKPLEVRMGKGKAETEYWAACIKPGMVLYEIAGVPEPVARQTLYRIAHKMPFKCRMISRRPTA